MRAAGFKAVFFPLAGRLDDAASLSSAELRELSGRGHTVGNQGQAHVDWMYADLTAELVTARKAIAVAAGMEVTEAAIQFGRYDRRVLKALREAGYAACYSSDGGPARIGNWPVARNSLTSDMDGGAIQALIDGHETLTRRLRRPLGRLRKQLS